MEKVILSVYWPDEWKKIELYSSDWRKIQKGKHFTCSGKGFSYEGLKYNDFWEFNNKFKGSCIVTYGDSCVGFEGSISDCEIKEVESRKYLNLDDFLTYFEPFVNLPTWKKRKYVLYENLRKYLKSCRSDYILSSRDNKSTIITLKDSFTIFKVSDKANGVLKQFRGQWVLMYMAHRYKFEHQLEIYPLKKGIDDAVNKNLKIRFEVLRKYKDSIEN